MNCSIWWRVDGAFLREAVFFAAAFFGGAFVALGM
jgi:hypothetical protein